MRRSAGRPRCRQALRCAAIHIGQCNHARLSIDFHGDVHPALAPAVMDRASRVPERANYENRFMALHPFAANPADGPRVRLEAVVSGHDANPDVLDADKRTGLLRAVSDVVDVPVSLELADAGHAHSRHHVMQLLQWGYEIGCQSMPTRRIIAGQYPTRHGVRVRYTNLDAALRITHIKDLPRHDGAVADGNRDQLHGVVATARAWQVEHRSPSASHAPPLRTGHKLLLARVTPWRSVYRLRLGSE